MKLDRAEVRKCLKASDFKTLFREHLGWDNHNATLSIPLDGSTYPLTAIAHKHGFVAYLCSSIPERSIRQRIDSQVTKSTKEHLIVYGDQKAGQQVWQWVRREPGKPMANRDHRYDVSQTGDPLIQRLEQIAISLDEEEKLTVVEVAARARAAFNVEKVTKQFYDRFKEQHTSFQKFIDGIGEEADLQWYTSLMLNRLMFVYFIQKKGFLDNDTDYLRNRMQRVQTEKGKDKFVTFYRYFLLRLFHDGLGKDKKQRDASLEKLLGEVPYLNGGFFEVHQLEEKYKEIEIPDKAFAKLFDFFDQYRWHLDERPLRADNEINPDVVGYIFEKYINQKQMGAYYTKEDITEYISKNTIIPVLFDAAEKKCVVAFKPDSYLWRLLKEDPDHYIYAAVKHGVIDAQGNVLPLPKEIDAGVKDVAKREGWNKPAPEPFALPTETWREHVARRTRCLEIRESLKGGKVHSVNDLITLNLDIWQFARDAINKSEGPELLRAFWYAIEKVTVLDPTCGSGAFLFAALRILESLYSDCLERMEQFVEDASAGDNHPEKFSDFKAILAKIDERRNKSYFILKSIIINNLYGVDIMEEAVEICKLRLFLKLVAQVDTADEIEPLPDIDFNIRAGNTLVGFATLDHVRKSMEGKLGFAEKQIEKIRADAIAVECVFKLFREQQTTLGGTVTAKEKQDLRRRLTALDSELDRYLAGEYGIDVAKKQKEFEKWHKSHEPFHWFVEFYGIMRDGGFGVIIGNPPYIEYSKIKPHYTVQGYATETCGNLYAMVWERCLSLAQPSGQIGMIQPVAAVCTEGYAPLQLLLRSTGTSIVSNFNDRPSKLFDGLEHIRLCIIIQRRGSLRRTFSTGYNKWQSVERQHLFHRLAFTETTSMNLGGAMAKIGSAVEASVLSKVQREPGPLGEYEKTGKWSIFYTRKLSHFVQILDFIPAIRDGAGRKREPSELKQIAFAAPEHRDVFLCILNSSLFYWMLTVYSDCRNLNRRDIGFVRFDFNAASSEVVKRLQRLGKELMEDIRKNSRTVAMSYKGLGELRIQCTYPKLSKGIIDEIDEVLAQHYQLASHELDFIHNFDIKYRVGADADDDAE